jgi:hypothetical protein
MKNILMILMTAITLLACKNQKTDRLQLQQEITQLKDSTAIVRVSIDHENFYPESSTFTGRISLADNMFRVDLFDQYEGNTMMIFQGKIPYGNKALKFVVTPENRDLNSVMMGKVIDKEKNLGSGYVMTEGTVKVLSMSRNHVILELSGKMMHYASKKVVACSGNLLFSKPTYLISNLKDEEIFY